MATANKIGGSIQIHKIRDAKDSHGKIKNLLREILRHKPPSPVVALIAEAGIELNELLAALNEVERIARESKGNR